MANVFDQFDAGNPFDQFDSLKPPPAAPKKIGKDANADFLRAELESADWGTRNIAAAGTALSDLWERGKQLLGKGDREAIEANKIISESAPVGAAAGQIAVAAAPFGLVGNSIKSALAVGAGLGAARPVGGEQTFENIARGTAKNVVTDAALGGAGQKVANLAGDWVSKKVADFALKKAQNAERDATLRAAQEEGFVVPPSTVQPTWWNQLKESAAGKVATAQEASNRNAQAFEKAIRKDLQLADDAPLNTATMQAARDRAYDVGYKPLESVPALNWDPEFVREVGRALPSRSGGVAKSPGHAEIAELIQDFTARGQWTGPQLVQDIRQLRENAFSRISGANNSAQKDLGRAELQIADALEELAERNLQKLPGVDPSAVKLYREARRYIAKTHTAEDAIVQGSGQINPSVLAKRVQKQQPLDGAMEVAGRFANVFPKASQPPAQIGSPGVSALLPWVGGHGTPGAIIGGAVGGPAGAAVGGAIGAAAPLVTRPLMRKYLLGKRSQNALRDLYELGFIPRTTAGLLEYAPVGSTVFGANALLE